MNLSALPDRRAAENPFGPAVADDTTDLDNAQFLAAVRRAAAPLRGHGVSAGDVVAISAAALLVDLLEPDAPSDESGHDKPEDSEHGHVQKPPVTRV
jgi:hypothetical protein